MDCLRSFVSDGQTMGCRHRTVTRDLSHVDRMQLAFVDLKTHSELCEKMRDDDYAYQTIPGKIWIPLQNIISTNANFECE